MTDSYLNGKVVLVTGGTGSFGRKFTQALLDRFDVQKLILFSRDELKQHEMRQSLAHHPRFARVRFFIGDVRDRERLYRAFTDVDVVVHAAALKQVPACEYNPFEAVQTNVLGAKNIIDAAVDRGVKRVLAISTDKAVNPVNLYGATKLCAEKLFIQGNAYSAKERTLFSCARYGNVVGSRGSVIPVFLEQKKTGTISITDERMTRFWLTLDQGVDFVLHCIEVMGGREIFVPKIPSMKVTDLAEVVAPGCKIRNIGIRPGEKLHEVLISEDEARHAVDLPEMYVIQPDGPWLEASGWLDAPKLPTDFTYASNTNDRWLTAEELRALLGGAQSP